MEFSGKDPTLTIALGGKLGDIALLTAWLDVITQPDDLQRCSEDHLCMICHIVLLVPSFCKSNTDDGMSSETETLRSGVATPGVG